jgi:hypothetical protein
VIKLQGVQLPSLPGELAWKKDLEFFEGPLLAEFRNAKQEPYLCLWCDTDRQLHRWLLFRTSESELIGYLAGKVSLRRLVENPRDGFLYVNDVNGEGRTQALRLLELAEVPTEYLPGAASQNTQDVLITGRGELGYESLSQFPRKYLQAYAFVSLFGKNGNPRQFSTSQKLTKGWVFHTLFEKMRRVPEARADLDAIAFASPGYMRFKVNGETADDLRSMLRAYNEHRPNIRSWIQSVNSWANGKREMDDSTARRTLSMITKNLGVELKMLLERANTPQRSVKIVASLVRRLEFLLMAHVRDTASIVGLEVEVSKQLRDEVDDLGDLLDVEDSDE